MTDEDFTPQQHELLEQAAELIHEVNELQGAPETDAIPAPADDSPAAPFDGGTE